MKRLIAAVLIVLLVVGAAALVEYTKTFTTYYKLPKAGSLAKQKCAVCHVGMKAKLNPYGLELEKAMKAGKADKLTAGILKKVEMLDSDKDGVKNVDEIKAGTSPGNPKSKPPRAHGK
jgi:hypothetical protein